MVDLGPTTLEACKIPAPNTVDGIPQKPIEGVSMAYSFDDPAAMDHHTTQYGELVVHRANYDDGWVACSRFGVPWTTAGKAGDFDKAPWELYHVADHFSAAVELAATGPARLAQLRANFLEEAGKYGVLPLAPRLSERLDPRNRIAGEPRTSWTYFGNRVWRPEPIGPILFPQGHTMTAELVVPKGGAKGVITCADAFPAGWSLYVDGGKPDSCFTAFDVANVDIVGTSAVRGRPRLDHAGGPGLRGPG